jgi:diaminohydroxyphosphoribosylaminopyrimidine deaminase/5-amino-6-(5-phosphoribosylamino)uracil reductase
VLDSTLRTPPGAKMFAQPGTTAIYCVDDGNRQGLERAGATIISIAADDGKPDLDKVLENLAQQGVNDVLVEAGPTLSGALLTAGQVDELVIYQAPHIMGSETRRMASTPSWLQLNQRLELEIIELDRIGPDLRIRARPAR